MHPEVGVDVLELLARRGRGSGSPSRRRRTPRGCRSPGAAARPCPSGSRARSGARGRGRGSSGPPRRRPVPDHPLDGLVLVSTARKRSCSPSTPPRSSGRAAPSAITRRASSARSVGTSTRTTANERTLGSGSWWKVWSTTSASMPASRSRRAMSSASKTCAVSATWSQPPYDPSPDSGITVLPDGLALGHDGLQALLGILGGHELVQVDVLGVAQGVGGTGGRARPRWPGG